MSNRYLAYVQLTAAMITVGSTVIASKVIGVGLNPILATALRFAIALPFFLVLMRATRTTFPRPGLRDALLLVAQATTGSVGYTILLIAGTAMTSAADAGIILGTLPAVSALTAALVLREPLGVRTITAVLVATSGVLLVTLTPAERHEESRSLLGDGLVLAAVFCESLFILLNKRLSTPWPPLALSTVMTALGLMVSGALAISQLPHLGAPLPLRPVVAVMYYALVPTVAGFWLWYSGAGRVSGGEAAVFTAVAPVSGVVLARLVLGDPITPLRLGGLSLVIVAVFLTAAHGRIARRAQPSHVSSLPRP
jgi:drug/metabolite transporter (DMT)-like permease